MNLQTPTTYTFSSLFNILDAVLCTRAIHWMASSKYRCLTRSHMRYSTNGCVRVLVRDGCVCESLGNSECIEITAAKRDKGWSQFKYEIIFKVKIKAKIPMASASRVHTLTHCTLKEYIFSILSRFQNVAILRVGEFRCVRHVARIHTNLFQSLFKFNHLNYFSFCLNLSSGPQSIFCNNVDQTNE